MAHTCIGLVHKDPGSDYGISFPDLPGCITAGSTIVEAREMAADALMLYMESLARRGENIPEPCSADEALQHEDADEAIAFVVVTALPERTVAEAQAAVDGFMASDICWETYGEQVTRAKQLRLST